jgi:hypothetical protein
MMRAASLFIGMVFLFGGLTSSTTAISNSDLNAIFNEYPLYDDQEIACSESSSYSFSGGGSLPSGIAEPWRGLIAKHANDPRFASVDPRLVASVLWVENRGWPEFKKTGWAVSSAAAQGPWQFIPSTWSLFSGKYDLDGNKDGREDPNDPEDAVIAAYYHHLGSAGKPLVSGFSGNADADFDSALFRRDRQNLLSFAASYNGNGAPSGVLLKNFPRGENSDYVVMNYWILATNFTKALNLSGGSEGKFIDLASGQTVDSKYPGTIGCTNTQQAGGDINLGGIVYYSQCDPAWASHPYDVGTGGDTVCSSGCGPTSLAMIISTLTTQQVSPVVVADWSKQNGHRVAEGSSWQLFYSGAPNWGLKAQNLGTDISRAQQVLAGGGLVIMSVGESSVFTNGGHLLVLRAYKDGKYYVADPNDKQQGSPDYQKKSLTGWDEATIMTGLKTFIGISR